MCYEVAKVIEALLKKSDIIHVRKGTFFAVYKNWSIKIVLSESQQEYWIYHNSVFMTCYYEFKKDFEFENSISLMDYLKKTGGDVFV